MLALRSVLVLQGEEGNVKHDKEDDEEVEEPLCKEEEELLGLIQRVNQFDTCLPADQQALSVDVML